MAGAARQFLRHDMSLMRELCIVDARFFGYSCFFLGLLRF